MAAPDRSLAILDVGHGNCAVLRDRRGVVVIDAGPGSGLLEFLTEHKITNVDVILLSHADKDHIGGVAQLLASKTVRIGRVCLNTDSAKGSDLWNDLLYELSQADNRKELKFDVSLARDDSGQFDQGEVHIEILGPSKYLAGRGAGSTDRQGRLLTSNSLSAVIRLTQNGKPIALLPGDVDEIGLDDLLGNAVEAKAPLLVYPHHGGRGGADHKVFIEKICQAFAPAMVVFSVARGRPKHPLPTVIKFLRQQLKSMRIVCTQLTEHCASRIPGTDPKHLANVFAQGRETRSCCGGTIVIALDDVDNLLPNGVLHRTFINSEAPTGLCR
jgi:competence protein ComEC